MKLPTRFLLFFLFSAYSIATAYAEQPERSKEFLQAMNAIERKDTTLARATCEKVVDIYNLKNSDPWCALLLGSEYYKSQFGLVPIDLNKAITLLKFAAERELKGANERLGDIYWSGAPPLIEQNRKQAILYYQNGGRASARKLGLAYATGVDGVIEKDEVTALKFMNAAASQGDDIALKTLKEWKQLASMSAQFAVDRQNVNSSQEFAKSKPQDLSVEPSLLSIYQDMLRKAKVRDACMIDPALEKYSLDMDRKIETAWNKACQCEDKSGGQVGYPCVSAGRSAAHKIFSIAVDREKVRQETERVTNLAIAKKMETEKEENRKKQLEEKAQAEDRIFTTKIQMLKQQSNISPERLAIWISPKNYLEDKRANTDANLCFGRINENWRDNVLESNKFIAPVKGEFEKTIDYDKRVQLAQAEFASQKKQRELKTQEYFSERLNVSLGEPIISDIQYNADSETFKFNVISSICQFSIAITAKSKASDAPKFKEKLERLQPSVALELVGETLFVRHVALFDGQTLVLNARPNVQIPYNFNDEEVKKYKIAAEKENVKRQAQNADASRRREAELMQKQWYRVMKAINGSGMICDVLRDEIQRYGEGGQPENIVNQIANDNYKKARQNGCVR